MKKTRRKRAFQHNIDAANAVINELRVNQKALAVQSTGTGKSYVMREIIEKFPLKTVMVIGPSWKVLTEVKGILDTRKTNCTIEYATYIGLAKRNVNSLPTGLDAIIIDEVHHLPAPVWGRGVKELENVNPQAKLIGFTGTPQRTDGIDVSQSHFNGETTKMDYVEAWEKGILPTPKFVNVYFKVDENPINVAKSYLEKKGISDTNRVEAEKASKVLELEWDRIKETQSKIIKRHLRKTAQKIIVFFDNISDLEKFSGEVESWFRAAGFDPTSIPVHSKLSKDVHDYNWEQALLPSKNGELKLIMSVSMLNEGVHIPEVESVMFLRRTVSSIIYLQQLGRCMKARQKQQPTVFDFVGNIESAGETISTTFNKNVVAKIGSKRNQKPSFGLKVFEYGKNMLDILSKIKKLTTEIIVPKILIEAHKTGDYSKIKPSICKLDYQWLRGHKKGGSCSYYPFADVLWNELQDWKMKTFIPLKLQRAHETGDYSEITFSTREYNWLRRHRGNCGCVINHIAEIMWKEYQEYKKKEKSSLPLKLQKAYETGDYSEIRLGTYEYTWIMSHKGENCTDKHYSAADIIWAEYQKWKKGEKEKTFIPPKLQKAHETGDYSEITYRTHEYDWIMSHKNKTNRKRRHYYPIADVMWKEYQEWFQKRKLITIIHPRLQKAHETGDYSEITSRTLEYKWIQAHRREGSNRKDYYPIAKILWEEYQEWRSKFITSPGTIIHPRLQKAHETGDYSKIVSGTLEYAWIHRHSNEEDKRNYYPLAAKLWNEYQKWKERKEINVPPRLQKAHETGDYSWMTSATAEYSWLQAHYRKVSNKKAHPAHYYPIADIIWNEYQEWRKKNKK